MPRQEATARSGQIRRSVALPATLPHTHPEEGEEPEQVQGDPESNEQTLQAAAEETTPRQQQQPQQSPQAARQQMQTIRQPISAGANPRAAQAAADRALQESQTVGGLPNPSGQPAGTKRLGMRTPLIDVTNMTGDQAKEALQRLLTQRQNQMNFAVAKAIRFNNGAEPNVQNGEVVSARDTGSISVYGFARRPLTLYLGQWIQLAHYMIDILKFGQSNLEEINAYVAQRLGNNSKAVSRDDIQAALDLFCVKGE